ncbi:hypothetical protein C8F01DRAFT_1260526 [Mycena amicta]|nr:hypothetical protein C8F01DRAFT_1260526 [Mycena amicta]
MSARLNLATFPGLSDAVQTQSSPENNPLARIEVEDDIEGEQENLPDPVLDDNGMDADPTFDLEDQDDDDDDNNDTITNIAELRTRVIDASKGVSEGTDAGYRRYPCSNYLRMKHQQKGAHHL